MKAKLIIAAICTLVLLPSCKKEDNGPKMSLDEQLLGTWECFASKDFNGGKQITEDAMVGETITIYPEHRYQASNRRLGIMGSFSIDGDKMTVKPDDGNEIIITFTLKDNTWVLKGEANGGFEYTFIKAEWIGDWVCKSSKDEKAGEQPIIDNLKGKHLRIHPGGHYMSDSELLGTMGTYTIVGGMMDVKPDGGEAYSVNFTIKDKVLTFTGTVQGYSINYVFEIAKE